MTIFGSVVTDGFVNVSARDGRVLIKMAVKVLWLDSCQSSFRVDYISEADCSFGSCTGSAPPSEGNINRTIRQVMIT